MKTQELEVTLIPLSDEAYSWEMQTAFEEFAAEAQSNDVLIFSKPVVVPPGYVGAPADLLSGEFLLKLIPMIGPIVGTATGAWLHARYGRKVRLKAGELEAEAQTVEEVERLLARAQEIHQRNQPKVIHEP
jgi:hypothetical protein